MSRTPIWTTARFAIDLGKPRVMGIVNATPDSFSDGGQYFSAGQELASLMKRCESLLLDGVDILDIGGESTRPGARPLPVDEELARVLPIVGEAVKLGVPVSVDTYKPRVMQAVLDLGADIINDIWSLRQPGAKAVIGQHAACGVCLMHMHGEPMTMQISPMEGDVVPQVREFLAAQAAQLLALGMDASRIVLDPGIGFGKTVAQNFALLARQSQLLDAGFPVLAGWSRKSSLAAVTRGPSDIELKPVATDRLAPSIAAAVLAVERGARVVRVHDVRETVQALRVWAAAS